MVQCRKNVRLNQDLVLVLVLGLLIRRIGTWSLIETRFDGSPRRTYTAPRLQHATVQAMSRCKDGDGRVKDVVGRGEGTRHCSDNDGMVVAMLLLASPSGDWCPSTSARSDLGEDETAQKSRRGASRR